MASDSPAARAILAFFHAWEPEKARENAALLEHLEEILAGGNLVFRTEEGFVHDDPAVRQAWEAYYNNIRGWAAGRLFGDGGNKGR